MKEWIKKLLERPAFPKISRILKMLWKILLNAIEGLGNDRVHKLSASLAYTAIFSIAPFILMVILIGGIMFENSALQGSIFNTLKGYVGPDTANTIQEIILKISFMENISIATVISSIILLVTATGLFVEIQDSLNHIWGVRTKDKKGISKLLLNRGISLIIIILIGIFMVLLVIINTLLVSFSQQIVEYLPFIPLNTINWVNTIFLFVTLSFFFGVIFKWLPDVEIKTKDVIAAAIVTAVLFLISKWLISLYISRNKTVSLYGAAGSVIILLLWIYLTAFIFFFGAELTRAIAEYKGRFIKPRRLSELSDKRLYEDLKLKHEELEKKYNQIQEYIYNDDRM